MKSGRLLVYLLMAVNPLLMQAQRAAFGPFVIDSSTVGNLEALVATTDAEIHPYHDSVDLDYSGNTTHFYEIIAEQNQDRLPGPRVSFTPTADNRLFYVDNLRMGQLLVTSMWLGYRGDVLQLLQCDAKSQLALQVHQHYGKGQPIQKSITLSCKGSLPDSVVSTIPQFVTEWLLADGVLASYDVGSYFDKNCTLQRYAVFRLENRIKEEYQAP
jgi:hypothetical protein